jgi:hypothetical protein
MSTYSTKINVGDEEDVPVTVHYNYCRLIRGATDGRGGPKLEPDEPEHIEIDWIEASDGRSIEPTTGQEMALEEEIMDYLSDRYFDD